MSWLQIVLITWVGVGLLVSLGFLLLAARANRPSGFELERNPIAWIPYLSICILFGPPVVAILLAVLLVGVPLSAVMSRFEEPQVEEIGDQVRFLDQGLEIYNRQGVVERRIEWVDVERAEVIFSPPVMDCPRLMLRGGEGVWLFMVRPRELAPVLKQHGIPFDRRSRELELDADGSTGSQKGLPWER